MECRRNSVTFGRKELTGMHWSIPFLFWYNVPNGSGKIRKNKFKILLAFHILVCYNSIRCDVIAVKREVANRKIGFSVERMS